MLKKPILLYDQDCMICVRIKKGIEYFDQSNSVVFIPIQDQSVYDDFPILNRDECHETVHLITSEGQLVKGDQVIDELVKTIPQASKLYWLFENQTVQKLKKNFYDRLNMKKQKSSCCQKN
jgi:predicted DCC family thiol-disulfide oxidoreductase YuxK